MKKFTTFFTTLFLLYSVSSSLAALEAPMLSSSTNGVDITIDWTSVSGATGYTLYYAPVTDSGYGTISSKDMGASTAFNYTLSEGASYAVAVKAYNDQESSPFSNIETLTITYTTAPQAPQLTSNLDGTSLFANWGSVPGATGYRLYYTLSAYTGQEAFLPLDVGNQTSFSYQGLAEGQTYSIAVVAYNDVGESDFSKVDQLTVTEENIGDDPLVFSRETLTFGTYKSQVVGDLYPTIFVFNGDETGSWSYREEGGSITWDVIDGVLVIKFGSEFEEYTLTSGSTLSGTVNIDFSDEPTKAASWVKIADTATDLTTLLSGRTFYTTVSGQYGTLEIWAFNETVTQMTYQELIDTDGELSSGDVEVVSAVDMVLTFDDPEEGGVVDIYISEITTDYIVVGNIAQDRLYFDRTKAEDYFGL